MRWELKGPGVYLDQQEQLAIEDHVVFGDQQGLKGLLENRVLLEEEVCLDLMDLLGLKVKMGTVDLWDHKGTKVNLEIWEDLVHLDYRG